MFTAAAVAIQLRLGAYATERGLTADEAAHFVNALVVFDWLREAPLSDPLRFARAYYLHFPRVSIGHWPPLFYLAQAGVFAVFGRGQGPALALQAALAGLACAWPAALVQRRLGWVAGFATGLFVFASPVLMFQIDAVMLDIPLGVAVLAAALAWARFAQRPSLAAALLFAALASAAILTKGNGFALAALPLLHAAMLRDARPLRDWRAVIAATLVGLATLPWTALTWRMTASGFNYAWGWDYTGRAIPGYAAGLLTTLGPAGLIGFVAGILSLIRRRGGTADPAATALTAAALALLAFQLVVPADIAPRYLVSLVPAAAVPIALGVAGLVRLARLRPRMTGGLTALVLLVGAAAIAAPPHLSPFGILPMVGQILSAGGGNRLVLVAASPRAEGAAVAAFAERDRDRGSYVLRASQQLAQAGFMGQNYAARFADTAALGRWLADSGIGWLLLEQSPEAAHMLHLRQLGATMATAGWPAAAVRAGPNGEMRLYRLATMPATAAQLQALLARAVPNRAPALGGAHAAPR